MKTPRTLIVGSICILTASGIAAGHDDHDHDAPPAPAERRTVLSPEQLTLQLKKEEVSRKATAPVMPAHPPLPDGVTELTFKEFFKMPVGPVGLEPSPKLLSLNGKRVRLIGYMAAIRPAEKRTMIFSPVPLKPQPEEYGQADEIPATHVLVSVPGDPAQEIPFTPGPMLLTGVLEIGSKEGSPPSFVRMRLDPPAQPTTK